jgi:hypothetical protein
VEDAKELFLFRNQDSLNTRCCIALYRRTHASVNPYGRGYSIPSMNGPIRSLMMPYPLPCSLPSSSTRDIRQMVRQANGAHKQERRLILPSVALLLLDTHAKILSLTLLDAERCESGRIDMLGKHASRQRDRGFESHPLRHTAPQYVPIASLPR